MMLVRPFWNILKSIHQATGRRNIAVASIGASVAIALAIACAQPPDRGNRDANPAASIDSALKRLMSFDANSDGKLSKDEMVDSRLTALFQRADTNNDGIVTREELTTQLGEEAAAAQRSSRPGGPGGPPDGPFPGGPPPGGPDGRGPGGRGGPGQILPPFLQDELNLTEAQRREVMELQRDVDTRLAKILTPDQQQQLQQMRNRGPGPGGPGGGRGDGPPGRPGGPPPDGGLRGDGGNTGRRPQRPQ